MKITFLSFVLLVALTTKPLLGVAGLALDQVVDTSGKKVRAGANYYIVPASSDVGGLSLASIGKDCPLDVVAVDGYQGLPLVFTPINQKKGVVRVDTDLNIYFNAETSCPQSTVWKLYDEYDAATGQWLMTTGGVIGNPGSETLSNWFKIEKYEDAYKLVFCPGVCNYCDFQCSDIGIYEDQYGKRLALTNVPYKVRFQQA
ncbi:Proteinase inhibitor I3, Kunitz legume [Sesbania bispinosa]|nr:Proteinase inhibitor I3, Kunitz legume [Sesbania bispinosa]KAJ1386730.1 Proteinase inhibitor I3, Kunitz legume [Sesbania bispinosa]